MALKAVFFDVGETLVDEERWWRVLAERSGLQPHVVWAALGVTIERGEEHNELWRHLGVERPTSWADDLSYELDDLYPDAIACLESVRRLGLRVGIVGNQPAADGALGAGRGAPGRRRSRHPRASASRSPIRASSSSSSSSPGATPSEVAYVGDRVDNDVLPAAAAGLVAIHVRRGPWGMLQPTPPEATSASTTSPRSPTR